MKRTAKIACLALLCVPFCVTAPSQENAKVAARNAAERELESIAVIERKVMVPMRDGKRMQADIYRPKDSSKRYPILFSRTPYDFNYWDPELGAPADMSAALKAVKHGYAYVVMNERGRYYSEGDYEILGVPLTDADDELDWMGSLPWSANKVGLVGCSSTAEWQLAVAARGNKTLAAFLPESYGAGVGRVAPYYEQGNWFRGGAMQMLFIPWLYDSGLQIQDGRPNFPAGTTQQTLVTAAKSYDLVAHPPAVDWAKALRHLPVADILNSVGAGHGVFADTTPSGQPGMILRAPNDASWYKGGLWNDGLPIKTPGLWFMTWYDISVAPNLAAYNAAHAHGAASVADEQYAIIAPVGHCAYQGAEEHTIVGERDMGDARLDYDAFTYGWFDHFLKGQDNGILGKMPKVQYYTMGSNHWQSSDTWPPAGARPVKLYLGGQGHANSLSGDGVLKLEASAGDVADTFLYDPMNPVPTRGGGFCCLGADYKPGAVDQRPLEARNDILVYSTEPLKQGMEVSGPVEVTLYLSTDVKDTDLTVKLIDVLPNGTAYNIDDNIQRVRYREGYDKPPVLMEKDKVYKVTLQPMQTSNYFAPGERLRIEVSSSNFPRYDRNLNTGGNNETETSFAVAHNQIHHSQQCPSSVTLSVVSKASSSR